jgi:hypothetical protein
MAPGAEVVEQNDVLDVEFLGKDGGVDGPGKIGGADAIVDDRAGDAETGGANFFVTEMGGGDAGKFLGDEIEGGEILAAEALFEDGCEPAAALGKKREVAFGAADITGQNHEIPHSNYGQHRRREKTDSSLRSE